MRAADATSLNSVAGGIALLVGGGLFAALAAMLSTRESRNKRYDDRRDTEMTQMREERDRIKTKNNDLETENDRLRVEVTRLRVKCVSEGIDPDSPARIV